MALLMYALYLFVFVQTFPVISALTIPISIPIANSTFSNVTVSVTEVVSIAIPNIVATRTVTQVTVETAVPFSGSDPVVNGVVGTVVTEVIGSTGNDGANASCYLATIPGWDSFCPDQASSTFASLDAEYYLGEITLNWTLSGLEEALLEVADYVYENYNEFLEIIDEFPSFSVNVFSTDDSTMVAVFMSNLYNSSDYAFGDYQKKRATPLNSMVMQYRDLAPAVAGYTYQMESDKGGLAFPDSYKSSYQFEGTFGGFTRRDMTSVLDICLQHYVDVLASQDPSWRAGPVTIVVSETARQYSLHPHHYYYYCFYQNSSFSDITFSGPPGGRVQLRSVAFDRVNPCVFDTTQGQNLPLCLWTEYGSKYLLDSVAANASDSSPTGFYDEFITGLAKYVSDGEQGLNMPCDLNADCTITTPVPPTDAADSHIAGYLILQLIHRQWVNSRNVLAAYDEARTWAQGFLPPIANTMRIDITKKAPDDGFDFVGLFATLLGNTPYGKAIKGLQVAIKVVGFLSNLGITPPREKYPQPDLNQLSPMIYSTFSLLKENFIDAFHNGTGSGYTSSKRDNFLKMYSYISPPALEARGREDFSHSVEAIKPLMTDFVIAKVMAATMVPIAKVYYDGTDPPRTFDYTASSYDYNNHDSGLFFQSSDSGGSYGMQPFISHAYTGDFRNNIASRSPDGEMAHLSYKNMAHLPALLNQYWNLSRIMTSSDDCQSKRTGGQFPLPSNHGKVYPSGPALGALTEIGDIPACSIWNIPIANSHDDYGLNECRQFASERAGSCYHTFMGHHRCVDLHALCSTSYWSGRPTYSTMHLWALSRTGFAANPDDLQWN